MISARETAEKLHDKLLFLQKSGQNSKPNQLHVITTALEQHGKLEYARGIEDAAKKASGMRGGEFTKAIVRAIRALTHNARAGA